MSDEIVIEFSFPADEHGMIGRECPNPDCGRYFKVKLGTGIVDPNHTTMFCPYCEQTFPFDDFLTQDQFEFAMSHAERYVYEEVEKAISSALRPVRTRHSKSFVTWHYKPGTPPQIFDYVEEELQTALTCENCSLEYAVWGTFAVCPDCGQYNLHQMTEISLEKIETKIALKDNLYAKFGETEANFLQENLADLEPTLIENAYGELVTLFETFCKYLDRRLLLNAADPNKKKRGNLFQRLKDTRQWFQDQYNFDLFSVVSTDEINLLLLVFNKRHILTHNAGIIDQKYIDENGLSNDILGRKVEVTKDEITQSVELVRRIIQNARSLI